MFADEKSAANENADSGKVDKIEEKTPLQKKQPSEV